MRVPSILAAASWWLALCCASASADDNALSFGMLPFLPEENLETSFHGYADEIALAINRPVEFITYANARQHMKAVNRADNDIVWIGPLDVARAIKAGYVDLVRTNRDFHAILSPSMKTSTHCKRSIHALWV